MKMKKLAATVALAGAITVGTAGMAFAADGTSGSGSGAGAATSQTAHPKIRHEVRKGAFKVVLDTLGVSKEELKAALQGGQSISAYATSLGKDPQAVVDALVKAAHTHIDQAVTDGKLQQARADTIKSKVPDRVNTFVNRQFGQHAAAGQTQS